MDKRQTDFLTDFQSALVENNLTEATVLCKNSDNQKIVRENVWEILPMIAKFIGALPKDESKYIVNLQQLMEVIGEKCCPEDMLLGLHKELCDANNNVFINFLPALKKAMINLPEIKIKSTIWCFDAVQNFLYDLQLPENYNLEGEDKKILDCDKDVYNISELYSEVVEFYCEIANFYKQSQINMILAKYLLQLLGKPLVYLDLTESTKAGRSAKTIIHLIGLLIDPYKCLKWKHFIGLTDDLEVKTLALGNLFYLIVAKNVESLFLPRVYCNLYVFQNVLRFIPDLLNNEHNLVVEKGLSLAEMVIRLNSTHNLDYLLLDDPVHSKFCITLSNVIVFNTFKSFRQKGLEILKQYILLFENKGRYLLIYNIFNNIKHSGLLGYLITMYKDMLIEELKRKEKPGQFFSGNKLFNILHKFCYLEKKEETDLLEESDRIVSTLNFLRFLAIRDKDNKTKIWDYFGSVHKNYLEHLKKGLMLSKLHYNSRILELEKIGCNGDKKEENKKVSVNVCGEFLPKMSSLEEINVCKSSITGFDVMESLLFRLIEFIGHDME